MAELFTVENFVTLIFLVMLQAVLGFDNLLYISLESQKAPKDQQARVRTIGISVAVILRIVLLFVLTSLIQYFQDPVFALHNSLVSGEFNIHSLIVLLGGIFIIYTATKEIWHMMSMEGHAKLDQKPKSVASIIFWIILMNLVFSFDSILSAMALTDIFAVMATAIIIGGILMIWLVGRVVDFLQKNRMYEVLGLFILFVVGIMLVTEGGHLAELHLFENPITPMSKTTFYFILAILVVIDIVQGRYQKNLLKAEGKLKG